MGEACRAYGSGFNAVVENNVAHTRQSRPRQSRHVFEPVSGVAFSLDSGQGGGEADGVEVCPACAGRDNKSKHLKNFCLKAKDGLWGGFLSAVCVFTSDPASTVRRGSRFARANNPKVVRTLFFFNLTAKARIWP